MTDKKGLRLLGWAYGGVTAIVLLVAFVVVTAHVNASAPAHAGSTERLAVLPE
jgi:hypothetical protein